MTIAFMFPGQGSQHIGMGKMLCRTRSRAARAVFDEVDDALGDKLSERMWERERGGADADRECPAGAHGGQHGGHAVARSRVRRDGQRCGDRSSPATRSANTPRWRRRASFSLADAARLLKARGRAMQAGDAGRHRRHGGTARSRLSARRTTVARAAAQGEVCQAANDNAPGQVVVSGHQRGRRARHRARQGERRQARHPACR